MYWKENDMYIYVDMEKLNETSAERHCDVDFRNCKYRTI